MSEVATTTPQVAEALAPTKTMEGDTTPATQPSSEAVADLDDESSDDLEMVGRRQASEKPSEPVDPSVVPNKGQFFMHDDRTSSDSPTTAPKKAEDDTPWSHDKYLDEGEGKEDTPPASPAKKGRKKNRSSRKKSSESSPQGERKSGPAQVRARKDEASAQEGELAEGEAKPQRRGKKPRRKKQYLDTHPDELPMPDGVVDVEGSPSRGRGGRGRRGGRNRGKGDRSGPGKSDSNSRGNREDGAAASGDSKGRGGRNQGRGGKSGKSRGNRGRGGRGSSRGGQSGAQGVQRYSNMTDSAFGADPQDGITFTPSPHVLEGLYYPSGYYPGTEYYPQNNGMFYPPGPGSFSPYGAPYQQEVFYPEFVPSSDAQAPAEAEADSAKPTPQPVEQSAPQDPQE